MKQVQVHINSQAFGESGRIDNNSQMKVIIESLHSSTVLEHAETRFDERD
jgi:hypothetical protein